jgi:hypothetical protein
LRSEDLVKVKSVVKLLAGIDTMVLGTVRVSTIAEIWNISTCITLHLPTHVETECCSSYMLLLGLSTRTAVQHQIACRRAAGATTNAYDFNTILGTTRYDVVLLECM